MVIFAPADFCKRWNTAKTYFQSNRRPDHFANLGGFLLGLILGFPNIQPGPGKPQDWCKESVTLPAGWRSIEIERIWIRGKPWRLSATQGAPRARLEPIRRQMI
jgi:hypothetical protein